ncbi:GAF and ANTAR domain-containing protein [Williamsia serinedens]|uniref:GAF domain-containing protein n=1 Tax=Williamsia serinedens TaxID=391736 RepID=A0ABT1H2P0_9NOCA|nr:GAF and ANTAR domain-containing protein [Williamsia serinedens]MCP2161503.1 GAF domain-containing protein [Williamsia serinedens]
MTAPGANDRTQDTTAEDPAFDPRTSQSLLAATPEGTTEHAAQVAKAAAHTAPDAASLAAMLVALGGSIADEDDLVVLLQRVVDVAHDVIDGADCAGITIDLGGRTFTAVHTDTRTLRVDTEQYDAGDGPCLEAAHAGEVVRVDVTASEQRWPRFAAAAADEGIHSFLAAPLSAGGQSLGALNLYGGAAAAFDGLDADILDLLTTTVSRAIGDFARFRSALDVADALRAALHNRAPIEQAKGIIMADHGVDADRAFAVLRSQSQNTNRRVRDIADDLIASRTTDAP